MANSSTRAMAVRCQMCQRTSRAITTAPPICQECQRTAASQASRANPSRQPTSQSTADSSIPSAYLQLLDSRIADLESAAEASRSSDQSATNATGVDRSARSRSLKPVSVTQYMTDAAGSRSQTASPRQSQRSSIVMERFLNDPSEPDIV